MPVHLRRPGPPLDQFVENFWSVMDQPSARAKERILPDGGVEMIFNLGQPPRLLDRDGQGADQIFRTNWISGQRTESIVISPTPLVRLFGIRFRMWGAAPFLRQPLSEVADAVVELEHLWGGFARELHERLQAARTPPERFAITEAVLLRRLRDGVEDCRLAAAAARRLADTDPNHPVAETAAELGVGQRRLARVFDRTVGLAPKQLQRVSRFQAVIRRIGHAPAVDWTDVALSCGYHDQSHFIHEFTGFTRLTPSEYLTRRGEYLNYVSVD